MVGPKFTYIPILATLALKVLAGQAPQIHDNPKDVVAVADFPQGGKHKEILGTMKFFSTNGTVKVHWDVTKLPKRKGPFYYHIHEKPVGRRGNCEHAGTHFNPYDAPANCDVFDNDSYCQVGDLSGKHGWIDTTCFETSYYDPYLSLKPNDPAYVVGKSVVIHYPNLKKIACADIRISSESVSHADRTSKRNLKHNKDLVEVSIPDYEPEDEEEARMIEEAHEEWLKTNADDNGESTNVDQDDEAKFEAVDYDEGEDLDSSAAISDVGAEANITEQDKEAETSSQTPQQAEKNEDAQAPVVADTQQKEINLKDVVGKEGYESVVPEEKLKQSYETAIETTDCENKGNDIFTGFSFLVSGLSAVLGFLI